ncbi:MAG: four helix bundle protein [Roseivirga sp.]|jgi:four helix bundle protein
MRDFKSLEVWKKGHQMALDIYAMTKNLPKEALFGLVSQMIRSPQSMLTNIEEGFGGSYKKEVYPFYSIAMGSKWEYQLLLARDSDFIQTPQYSVLISDLITLKKQLSSFIQHLKTQHPNHLNPKE